MSVLTVRAVAVCGLVSLLVGCGGQDYPGAVRVPVSGTVTYDGKPVPYGVISFLPGGEDLRGASGPIHEGKYTIEEKFGPNVGHYKVSILGYPEVPTSMVGPEGASAEEMYDDEGTDMKEQMLPRRYNFQTTLEVDMVDGPNQHDFATESGRKPNAK